MQNLEGQVVDLYIPRKCSATNRLIHAKDNASIQITIPHVNNDGVRNGQKTTYAICGYLRKTGQSDIALTKLAQNSGFLTTFREFNHIDN